jgi:ubiquinone/menaquinone biosynthesis C-methylase UbiE
MRSHDQSVLKQFDPRAAAYLTSAVHAAGPDLDRARALLAGHADSSRRALDVGCGAGHLSFLLAQTGAEVVAADPSAAMLGVVRDAARARGFERLSVAEASAYALPFPAGYFDIVATRYSAHHWTDLPRAVAEMRRVLKAEGHLLVIDLLGDESPLVNTHLQAMEVLRDPSHVCNRTATQWRALLSEAGFRVLAQHTWPIRLEFASWTTRMNTPPEGVAAVRRLQTLAPQEVVEGLRIEPDGSFTPQTGLFWAQA